MALDRGAVRGDGRRAAVVHVDGHAAVEWGHLAVLAFGGRWTADEAMMRDAVPAAWERMVRLSNACPPESATALWVARMAVRTIPPVAEGTTAAPGAVAPGRPSFRGSRTKQQSQ